MSIAKLQTETCFHRLFFTLLRPLPSSRGGEGTSSFSPSWIDHFLYVRASRTYVASWVSGAFPPQLESFQWKVDLFDKSLWWVEERQTCKRGNEDLIFGGQNFFLHRGKKISKQALSSLNDWYKQVLAILPVKRLLRNYSEYGKQFWTKWTLWYSKWRCCAKGFLSSWRWF